MSNERVPGLPQLHDPILSWYIVTWTFFLRGINTNPFWEGMKLSLSSDPGLILFTLTEDNEFLCTLRNEWVGLKSITKAQHTE